MNVVVKPLEELHEAERNVRGHTPRQIAEYVRSIKRFGQMKPIVCDEHGEIVIGNGLYLALKEMGAETADCYVIEGWTEEQKLKLMLSDNKVYELGVSLDSVMQSIVREMDDVDIPGYSEDILLAIRSSVADVTSAISSYGMVSEEALRPIKAAASDDTRPPMYDAGKTAFTDKESAREDHSKGPADPEDAVGATSERFIVCPYCGEKISL